MAESALLNQIVTDYCAQSDEQQFQKGILDNFCQYAAKWLLEKGCVGLGQASSGMTLRFSDGRELSLFSLPESVAVEQPAISISGTKDKLVTKTMADTNPAVQITGRH